METASSPSLFQFTPLREGRPRCSQLYCDVLDQFQFTPLREGRRACADSGCWMSSISIHAPPRGATLHGQKGRTRRAISIHAPPRGATRPQQRDGDVWRDISIHAPPRGATPVQPASRPPLHFNSRPSARGDVSPAVVCSKFVFQFTPLREGRRRGHIAESLPEGISIHAPPRGATVPSCVLLPQTRNFNSRPSARGDGHLAQALANQKNFNSRPSARGDSTVLCRISPPQ